MVHGWHKITTADNRTYQEVPVNICGGTGSVIKVNGTYHMFYCTFDQDPPAQWARHAVSDDLTHWEDIPEDRFGPDGEIYRMSDWRDPFVFWNPEEKKWWMLLAARENSVTERNGCVALCVSTIFPAGNTENPFMRRELTRRRMNARIFFGWETGIILCIPTTQMVFVPTIV